eukprot:m.199002 g.199002  ORF g.199002 m.199002 type:complete len:648 (-) comp32717_c0_seq2:35-1978(-)
MSYEEPDAVYSGDELPSEESEDEYDAPALPNRHANRHVSTQPKPGGDSGDEDDYEVAIDIKKPASHLSKSPAPKAGVGDDDDDEDDYGVAIANPNPAPSRPKPRSSPLVPPKSPPVPPKSQDGGDDAEDEDEDETEYEVPIVVRKPTSTSNDVVKQDATTQETQEDYEVPVPVAKPPPRRLPSLPPPSMSVSVDEKEQHGTERYEVPIPTARRQQPIPTTGPVDNNAPQAVPVVPPRLTTPLAEKKTQSENYEVPTPRDRQQQQHHQTPLIEETIDENYEAPVPVPHGRDANIEQINDPPPLPPKEHGTNVLPSYVKPYKSSSEIASFEANDGHSDEDDHYEEIVKTPVQSVTRRVEHASSPPRPASVWVPGPEFPQLNNENQLLFFKQMKTMKETEGQIDELKLMEYAKELKSGESEVPLVPVEETRTRSGSMSKLLTKTKGSLTSLMRKVRRSSSSSSSSPIKDKDDNGSNITSPVPGVITEEEASDIKSGDVSEPPELPPAYVSTTDNNDDNDNTTNTTNDDNNNHNEGAESDGSGYEDVDHVAAAVSRAKSVIKTKGDTVKVFTPAQTNVYTAVDNPAVYTNVDDATTTTTSTSTLPDPGDDECASQDLYEDPDVDQKTPADIDQKTPVAAPPRPAPRRPVAK